MYWIFAPWGYCPCWDNEPPRELIELVEEKRLEPYRVLDVGYCTGNYIIYLASMGFEAVGIDISSAAVKKAS